MRQTGRGSRPCFATPESATEQPDYALAVAKHGLPDKQEKLPLDDAANSMDKRASRREARALRRVLLTPRPEKGALFEAAESQKLPDGGHRTR